MSATEYGQEIARERRGRPWELVGIEDVCEGVPLGERQYAECGFCGFPKVRYLHTIRKGKKEREVGCCCSARLCWDDDPKAREEEFKSRQAKKATVLRQRQAFDDGFPDKWIPTMSGNFRKTVRGQNVVIFKDRYGRGFCVVIDGVFGKKYPTPDEALVEAAKILYPMPEEEQV